MRWTSVSFIFSLPFLPSLELGAGDEECELMMAMTQAREAASTTARASSSSPGQRTTSPSTSWAASSSCTTTCPPISPPRSSRAHWLNSSSTSNRFPRTNSHPPPLDPLPLRDRRRRLWDARGPSGRRSDLIRFGWRGVPRGLFSRSWCGVFSSLRHSRMGSLDWMWKV